MARSGTPFGLNSEKTCLILVTTPTKVKRSWLPSAFLSVSPEKWPFQVNWQTGGACVAEATFTSE